MKVFFFCVQKINSENLEINSQIHGGGGVRKSERQEITVAYDIV